MIGPLGFPEIIMIFIVALIIFGPKKLPDFAKTLGRTIREFRKTINDAKASIEDEIDKADITGEIKELNKEIKEIIEEPDDGKS